MPPPHRFGQSGAGFISARSCPGRPCLRPNNPNPDPNQVRPRGGARQGLAGAHALRGGARVRASPLPGHRSLARPRHRGCDSAPPRARRVHKGARGRWDEAHRGRGDGGGAERQVLHRERQGAHLRWARLVQRGPGGGGGAAQPRPMGRHPQGAHGLGRLVGFLHDNQLRCQDETCLRVLVRRRFHKGEGGNRQARGGFRGLGRGLPSGGTGQAAAAQATVRGASRVIRDVARRHQRSAAARAHQAASP